MTAGSATPAGTSPPVGGGPGGTAGTTPPVPRGVARPAVAAFRALRLPAVKEASLDSGLQVVAARRPSVAIVELRLRIPLAVPAGGAGRKALVRRDVHAARAGLLAEALFSGTPRRDAATLAADLQGIGASLHAQVDPDYLVVSGSGLSAHLRELLALLAEVLTGATYPKRDVANERTRLVEELRIARSQPTVIAGEVLARRLYGAHPYGREVPDPADVAEVTRGDLRRLHAGGVGPRGATLVVVSDLAPARVLDEVAGAVGGWVTTTQPRRMDAPPVVPMGAPMWLVDRPGSVQTSVRLAGPAPARADAGYAAAALANLVFGGYFSSRFVANIRERHGYSYSPHSTIDHRVACSQVEVSAEVATEITAPALVETLYELGRISTRPVEPAELTAARRFALGSLALGVSSQARLAGQLSALAAVGLGVEWLRTYQEALRAVDVDSLAEAAGRLLAPGRLAVVLVGDAARVAGPVAGIAAIEPVEAGTLREGVGAVGHGG